MKGTAPTPSLALASRSPDPLAGGPAWWLFAPLGALNPLLVLNPFTGFSPLMMVWPFPVAPSFGGMGGGPGLDKIVLKQMGLVGGQDAGDYVPGQLPAPSEPPVAKANVNK